MTKILYTNKFSRLALAFFLFLNISLSVSAQSLDEARQMIKDGNYEAAREAFSELIKKNANRADVNKWYGESLYETGYYQEAEKYLKNAANKRIQGAYLYLGKLYQKTYKFKLAVQNLEKYQTFLKKDPEELERVDSLILECQLAEKALTRIEKVQIIDSIIVDKNKFFNYYKLSQETGKLLDYDILENADPEVFSVLFENQRADQRVFSMKNGNNGLDLYKSSKVYGNKWGEPLLLPTGINSEFNENFPFVMIDGLTIYYSSDMDPTFGGYDLYVSKYNPSNDSYYSPERLPMPFNSPFNDYLYVVDEGNNIGWFASDRFQPKDKVIVYLFIPNVGEKEYYEDLTPEQEIKLAQIYSIFETWPENASFDQLLHSIYNVEDKKDQRKGEFIFVINDNIVYYSLNDFESKEAKSLFEKYNQSVKQLSDIDIELDGLRSSWNKSNNSERDKMKNKILQLESRKINLEEQTQKLEISSRNSEIEYLRKRK